MENQKKNYEAPEVTVYGDVEEITQVGGFVPPTDTKGGVPGEAFPIS